MRNHIGRCKEGVEAFTTSGQAHPSLRGPMSSEKSVDQVRTSGRGERRRLSRVKTGYRSEKKCEVQAAAVVVGRHQVPLSSSPALPRDRNAQCKVKCPRTFSPRRLVWVKESEITVRCSQRETSASSERRAHLLWHIDRAVVDALDDIVRRLAINRAANRLRSAQNLLDRAALCFASDHSLSPTGQRLNAPATLPTTCSAWYGRC